MCVCVLGRGTRNQEGFGGELLLCQFLFRGVGVCWRRSWERERVGVAGAGETGISPGKELNFLKGKHAPTCWYTWDFPESPVRHLAPGPEGKAVAWRSVVLPQSLMNGRAWPVLSRRELLWGDSFIHSGNVM